MNERPTEMTDRQLAGQIRFGRKVTFETPDLADRFVTGYVMGFDEDNIRLAVVREVPGKGRWEIANRAVNRAYIASIDFHSASTMSSESVADELEAMSRPVRDRILDEYFPNRTRR